MLSVLPPIVAIHLQRLCLCALCRYSASASDRLSEAAGLGHCHAVGVARFICAAAGREESVLGAAAAPRGGRRSDEPPCLISPGDPLDTRTRTCALPSTQTPRVARPRRALNAFN